MGYATEVNNKFKNRGGVSIISFGHGQCGPPGRDNEYL